MMCEEGTGDLYQNLTDFGGGREGSRQCWQDQPPLTIFPTVCTFSAIFSLPSNSSSSIQSCTIKWLEEHSQEVMLEDQWKNRPFDIEIGWWPEDGCTDSVMELGWPALAGWTVSGMLEQDQ